MLNEQSKRFKEIIDNKNAKIDHIKLVMEKMRIDCGSKIDDIISIYNEK